MLARLAIFALVTSLIGCAIPSTKSAYNLGVDAYRIKDYAVARAQWSKAADAEEGKTSALSNLGYLLYFGLGGPADVEQAIALWKRAAAQGHSEAQWHLGHAYEVGNGVQQSNVEAYAWYRCSIASASAAPEIDKQVEAQISQDAANSLGKLLERLSAEQFTVSEQLAKQYIGAYARRKSGA